QPVLVEELDAIQTWEVLVARRPRLERHHAVAITDDALKAAIVLTDRFVPERARPDKAIDVLDEACAHAQASARVSPELDKLIRERRKLDGLIRRGAAAVTGETPAPDLATVIDQGFDDFREILGGERRARAVKEGHGRAAGRPRFRWRGRRVPRARRSRAQSERAEAGGAANGAGGRAGDRPALQARPAGRASHPPAGARLRDRQVRSRPARRGAR